MRRGSGGGTKIDNLVHIAHNCRIGEDVIIAAQVGMAGVVRDRGWSHAGGAGGAGGRTSWRGLGGGGDAGRPGGVVLPGKKLEGAGKVFWGTPAQPVREYLRDLARSRKR